jgi:phosphoglucomutase
VRCLAPPEIQIPLPQRRMAVAGHMQLCYFRLMTEIKFGTSGWQARMGKELTFHRVRLVTQAFANCLKKAYAGKEISVMLNYDTRYLSEVYAQKAAQILSLSRIHACLPLRDAPLPAQALCIVQKQMRGGLCFTSSLNEPTMNGIKLLNDGGAPALPSKTILLENEIKKIEPSFHFKQQYPDPGMIHQLDIRTPYLDYIAAAVQLDLIKRAHFKVIVDNLHGTSRDYLDRLLGDAGIEVMAIHNYADSYFGEVIPSCNKSHLRELARLVVSKKAGIGVAIDTPSVRFGIVDGRGHFIEPNQVVPPLLEYLISVRKMNGGIAKSVSATEQIARVADHYQRKVFETPVGFKYLADTLSSRGAFFGMEGSHGPALNSVVACKDGILSSLLILEMLAHHQQSLPQLLNAFYKRFPPMFMREVQVVKTMFRQEKFQQLLQKKSFAFPGFELVKVKFIDGIKFVFKNGWLLLRESGTVNAIRISAETHSPRQTQKLLLAGLNSIE